MFGWPAPGCPKGGPWASLRAATSHVARPATARPANAASDRLMAILASSVTLEKARPIIRAERVNLREKHFCNLLIFQIKKLQQE